MENVETVITMRTDTGETVEFYVLEERKISGGKYLLVKVLQIETL